MPALSPFPYCLTGREIVDLFGADCVTFHASALVVGAIVMDRKGERFLAEYASTDKGATFYRLTRAYV